MYTLLDGKKTSQKWLKSIKRQIQSQNLKIRLDIILVGDDYASQKYVNMKQKMAHKVGISGKIHKLPKDATTKEVISIIHKLNEDKEVTGFMVQLPMPPQIDRYAVLDQIDPSKDVDGLTSTNLGKIFQNRPALAPATPAGIMKLLEEYKIDLKGMTVAMVGASPIVGAPLAGLLTNAGATVTIAHKYTKDLVAVTSKADIVISATGVVELIRAEHIKDGAIVVDVGINKHPKTGKLVGDVKFDEVASKCSYITPVPGGVGPMTIAALIANTVKATERK